MQKRNYTFCQDAIFLSDTSDLLIDLEANKLPFIRHVEELVVA